MSRPHRVAALYDIHGNLPALDAVLHEVRDAKVDLVVSGGDVVFGPMPRECLRRLLNLDCPAEYIRGNCDRAVLQRMRGTDATDVPEAYRDLMRWSGEQIPDYEEILEERRSLDAAPITPDVMGLAVGLQHALARRGEHRVPIPDLIISAAARLAGLVVLHYDADFERIAAVGGAPHEWVVPQGSI